MENTQGVIYGLQVRGTAEIRYVGQTVNKPNRRMNQHRNEARSPGAYTPLYRWMSKHGPENIEMVLLEEGVPSNELNDRETYWIEKYGTFLDVNPRGLNLTRDGLGLIVAESSLKKKRNSLRVTHQQSKDLAIVRNRPGSTPEQVVAEIRDRFTNDPLSTLTSLGEELGVARHRIKRIVLNEEYPEDAYQVPETLRKPLNPRKKSGKLTLEQVEEIREVWLRVEHTAEELSALYGISRQALLALVNNRSWRDPEYVNTRKGAIPAHVRRKIGSTLKGVPKPEGFGIRGSKNDKAKLDESKVADIKRRLRQGELGKDLASEYGVTPTAISCINRGKTWKHVEVGD